jgi:hypothetical protein
MHKELQNIKTSLRKVFDVYIFSNTHVAFATFALTKITLLQIGISENSTAWFVFFSTLFSYNIIRFLRFNETVGWFQKWFNAYKKLLNIITIFSFLAVLYFGFQIRFKALLILFPFAVFTIFYVFPIQKYALRNIAGLKLFLIAISWSGITVLFPLVQNYMTLQSVDFIVFIQRFLFIVAITIPFDIRDVNYDSDGLKTLPQRFGIYKSKLIAVMCLMIILIFEGSLISVESERIIPLIITVLLSTVLLMKATKHQNKYYSAFFVEALPIIWYLFILINLSR